MNGVNCNETIKSLLSLSTVIPEDKFKLIQITRKRLIDVLKEDYTVKDSDDFNWVYVEKKDKKNIYNPYKYSIKIESLTEKMTVEGEEDSLEKKVGEKVEIEIIHRIRYDQKEIPKNYQDIRKKTMQVLLSLEKEYAPLNEKRLD